MRFMRQFAIVVVILCGTAASASAAIFGFDELGSSFASDGCEGLLWSGSFGPRIWLVGGNLEGILPGLEVVSEQKFAWSNGATNLALSDGLLDLNSDWIRGGSDLGLLETVKGFVGCSQTFDVATEYQFGNELFAAGSGSEAESKRPTPAASSARPVPVQ